MEKTTSKHGEQYKGEPTDPHKPWLTVHECATYLGLKPSSIYQMVAERRILCYKIPNSQALRFKRSELDSWLESGRVETVSQYFRRSHKKKGSGDGEVAQKAGQREQARA